MLLNLVDEEKKHMLYLCVCVKFKALVTNNGYETRWIRMYLFINDSWEHLHTKFGICENPVISEKMFVPYLCVGNLHIRRLI